MKLFMRLLIVAVMFTLAAETQAQTFGLRAGLNMANMLMKDDDDTYSDDFKMNPGFHIGPTAELPLNDFLSVEAALLLSTKGFSFSDDYEGLEMKAKANLLYIDLPVTAKASYDLNGIKIYGELGPYVGMGLTGKYKSKISYEGESETDTESVEWGSDDDSDLKRLDFGVVIGAGVQIESILVGLNYGLGLANVGTTSDDGYKENHRVLSLTVGYKF